MGLDQTAPRSVRHPDETGNQAALEEDCGPVCEDRAGTELHSKRKGGVRGFGEELSRGDAGRCGGIHLGDSEATRQEISVLVQEGTVEREDDG